MKNLILIIILLMPLSLNSDEISDVCFTKEEAETIDKQLDKDKKIILWQADRWKKLVNTQPKIRYKVVDTKVIIQTIEYPVKKDKPLIYKIDVEIDTADGKITFFPLLINLGIMIESGAEKFRYVDPKLGFQFLGLAPLRVPFIKGLGFHALIGVQSAGLSISWGWMKKPIKNLRFHFYGGVTYEGKESFGGGISLNF